MRQAQVDGPGVLPAVRRFWQRSYGADYVGIIMLVLANLLVCCIFVIQSFC